VLGVQLQFPPGVNEKPEQIKQFFDELLPRLRSMPGVLGATAALTPGPEGVPISINILGAPQAKPPQGEFNLVGTQYFGIFNCSVLRGRIFTDADLAGQRKVIVVNQAFAHRFFSKDDAVGQRVDFPEYDQYEQHLEETASAKAGETASTKKDPSTPPPPPPTKSYFEIVGVVSNVRSSGIQQEVKPLAFLPNTLFPESVSSVVVRTARNADDSSGEIFRQIWALNRGITLPNDRGSLESQLQKYDYARPQFEFIMLSTFAAVGLLLVIIGVYGVMAYNVSLQTRELGIRMALGAQQRDVLVSVLRRGTSLIAIGAVVGLFLSWAVTRLIQNQLWHVKPTDPLTLGSVTAIVLLVGLLACVGPARRATKVDPCIALREE
ncbi:MAG TPA: FtsX-like permease family protein, partial [Terriglobales bacterium]|nr:FtsX-like permease family protein [Terriglobales bacterium]